MTANEIFEIMARYSLTLLPNKETVRYTYSKSNLEFVRHQGEDYEIIDKTTETKLTHKQFEQLFKNSECAYINADGYLVRRYIKRVRQRDGGWLVKIDNSYNATQIWKQNGKTDFFGKTPEEAILKAVEYIENKK